MHVDIKCGGKEKSFFCEICNAAYFYKKDLKSHLIRHHDKTKIKNHVDGVV
nr:unnamed protein product [Callosobruchus analis]